ncbi:hypothetical protein [Streptomyces sp. L2]|uniref:hypothetical protein n=1 Tax=Streptomyces sp. L2 TaxID=2162665 RepID=UPI0013E95D30|nr:hypothetical protein [Streptomyces sp. L2]
MAPEPEQIPSRTCGCRDCLIDYPPQRYGHRPPRTTCQGRWHVRYRDADGRHRAKRLATYADAKLFLATVQPQGGRRAS